ncbi:MAG: hypothetical protein WC248_02055 [Candidatus Methanomethylophilaceae archaeon]|jgi:hypothetical protein
MIIPVIPSTTVGEKVLVGHMIFDGPKPQVFGDTEDFNTFTSELSSQYDHSTPFLIFDVKGMRNRMMNIDLLKNMKVHRKDIWFLTCIEKVEDVFDAFNTDADVLLIPYHTIISDDELKEIHRMSDRSFPALFVRNKMTYTKNGMKDINKTMEKLNNMGFGSIAVFDLSGTLTKDEWDALSVNRRILPFIQNERGQPIADCDFEWMFKSVL